MGIYLGQLPPAEIARLKAELAETLIANFCYPRFFDYRTESLQMRPVDRKKRQEVWLYLSSVDFTAWSRVDLTTPDFQHQIERLFIQFVQRNRSFFGEQGRRRMSDIRMLISTCASSVAQGLRNHLTGQKQNNPPFGSPRPVVSWATPALSGKAQPDWEQISAATMLVQQQLQEIRGEARTAVPSEPRPAQTAVPVGAASGVSRRTLRAQPTQTLGGSRSAADAPPQPSTTFSSPRPVTPLPDVKVAPAASAVPATPVTSSGPTRRPAEQGSAFDRVRKSGQLEQPGEVRQSGQLGYAGEARQSGPLGRKSGALSSSADMQLPVSQPAPVQPAASMAAPVSAPLKSNGTNGTNGAKVSPTSPLTDTSPSQAVRARNAAQTAPQAPKQTSIATSSATTGTRDMLSVGEDDVAIFEQMRHQLLVWLRVEAVKAELEFAGQSPTQMLELLRQQARLDETRLQVVSTLLNLSNQVVKTGLVSVLDYKQALMFHLMHTRP
jgi:hypothetical protein